MGCINASVLVDADMDTHFAITASCGGDDCDDTNPNAYPGASEMCTDMADLNCDGMHGAPPTYYADCDRDGYAPSGAATTMSCTPPVTTPTCAAGLTGQWISVAPTTGHTDCLDNTTSSSSAHPNQTGYYPTTISGLSPSFDYNCSGSATRELSYAASGNVPRGDTTACAYVSIGPFTICTGDEWYVTTGAPSCGASVTLSHCASSTFLGCYRTTTTGNIVRCH
jgi:hypothetical protein